ncbi:MAG: hypothetical protein GX415_02730 [Chloroflexi bacterium]|jgi:hypothetical protein|nr:hypothetical protein [Anaerolineaceae bacterium]NLI44317.1 hypothetical protein [Chloroflexota bacterium]
MNTRKLLTSILLVLSALLLIAGCARPSATEPTAVRTETATSAPTLIIVDTATPEPTPEPIALITADIVIWAPPNADFSQAQTLVPDLTAYAAANGLLLEQREQLSAAELGESVRLVVALASAAEISAAAAGAPNTQFLAVGVPDVQVGANVHSLNTSPSTLEERAFLAGYLLGMVIPDYRVGVISQAGTAEGQKTFDSFTVGARYFCGLCNSRFGPILFYPKGAQITDPANPGDWQAAADLLLANTVKGAFIQPEVSSPELVNYLQAAGVQLVGIEGQAGYNDSPLWLGLFGSDLSSDAVILAARLLQGGQVGAVKTGITLTHINADVITEGKQRLFDVTVQDVQSGLVRVTPVQ